MVSASIVTDSLDLKVSELLKEVQLNYTPQLTKLVDDTVSAIKSAIDNIPDDLQVTADFAPGFVRDVGADKVDFKFKKPKSIQVGGSYSIQCVVKPDVNVDVLIRLPKECFHEKDFLNHRYHAKRFLYLCVIKKYLKKSHLIGKVEWSTFQNEARKPVLIVHPAMKDDEFPGLYVRITPTATSLFNISKLKLTRNNLRPSKQGCVEGGNSMSTPKYNSSILEDMFLEDKTEFMKKTFSGQKALGEALVLMKVWARQRSSIYAHDCLNGFLISVIMTYLATECPGKGINNSMKAMHILRITLEFIATSKVWNNGLYFKPQSIHNISKEERKHYTQSFPVVLCDLSDLFNVAFRITSSGFSELRDEAALTRDSGFEGIFMTKIDFPAKYDYCMRLDVQGKKEVYSSGFCLDDECWRLFELKVHSVLQEALKDRVNAIRVTWKNTFSDCNVEKGLSVFDKSSLLVGLSVKSLENAFRMVDVGPNADSKEEAKKFRKFWGEKAELRRFKDGRIAESIVWESKPSERHLILLRITEYILSRHLSLSKENIVHTADSLDFSLHNGIEDPMSFSTSLCDAFDVLSKNLPLLQDIPLRVSSVQGLDSDLHLHFFTYYGIPPAETILCQSKIQIQLPESVVNLCHGNSAFRSTSVYPPKPHPLATGKTHSRLQKFIPTCIQPLEVMIQLEGSGNWLMDDVALEKTKSAFLLKIAESLQSNCGFACTATEDDVDVLVSGYAFRLKIIHERALGLLNRQVGSDQEKHVSPIDRKLFSRGQHSKMIDGLLGSYPSYGPVVRLAKRWVASHLFSACLEEEAVELVVAHLFLKPLPFQAPCSRISGFLRFLRFLSEYDWAYNPLIVDIKKDLSQQDLKEINDYFTISRKACKGNQQNPTPAMFIATAYDKTSEAWSKFSPNASELRRLVAYAQSTASLLTNLVLLGQIESYSWESLFRTPLNNYDAVVLLHRDRLAYPQRLLFPSELNQGRLVACGNASKDFHPFMSPGNVKGNFKELKDKLMVDYDPFKCFLVDLEKEFPDAFKVWFDSLGGDAVGLTWERSSSKKRGREDADDKEKKHVFLLKAVGEVGKGLVRSIYSLKAPRIRK